MSSVALCDLGLSSVPPDADTTATELNLSENALTDLSGLSRFTSLHTLVLDKNNLTTLDTCPVLPTVKTLWFNNNLVDELGPFLDQVLEKMPKLTMLSVMRNPAAPPLVSVSEEDAAAAKRYRLYIVYRLPGLAFLDSAPVTTEERTEAAAKGKFLAVRRPKPRAPGASDGPAPGGITFGTSPSAGAGATDVSPGASSGKRTPTAYLGLGHSRYDGRHSEGNRFIVDTDL